MDPSMWNGIRAPDRRVPVRTGASRREAPGGHSPVMLEEVLDFFCDGEPGLMVDGTAGYGGHLAALSLRMPATRFLAVDRDPEACEHLSKRFADMDRIIVRCGSFARLPVLMEELRMDGADAALFDLGVSSCQLDDPERGFSHSRSGPLDMRFDPSDGSEPASRLVNHSGPGELADVLHRYGELRGSRRIARSIVESRPISLTTDLAAAISRGARTRSVKVLSRAFQAIRIAVNRELEELETLLGSLAGVLSPGAKVAFLTFHSLEDRLVKLLLRDSEEFRPAEPFWRVPDDSETASNPRSRSARLRMGQRT